MGRERYIKLYENFKEGLKVEVYNYDEFSKVIYGDGGMPIDDSVFDRILYMDAQMDFGWNAKSINPHFIVLYKNDKIIGVAKIGNYPYKPDNRFSLSYLSVDEKYRGLGYSKIMVDKLFKFLKNNNYTLDTSKYTEMGNDRLRKSLIEYSNKYNVKFIDNE